LLLLESSLESLSLTALRSSYKKLVLGNAKGRRKGIKRV
jgi:hypothetical protein